MNKNNQYINFFNRFWNYYKSNRSLLLIIIIVAALPAITVQAAVNTQEGTNVNVQFEDEGINITFAEVTKSGNTSVDTSLTGPDLPDGYGLVGEYRNITTTAKYTGNTSVCIDYSNTNIVDESALKLFHYETGESESIVYVQTVYRVDSTWDLSSVNHPSLLYFDFEEGEGCENLHVVINGHDGCTINGSDNNLVYNTSMYDKNGEPFIAWLGKQFCVIDNGVDWNISKVLTDENEDDTHMIHVNESLNLPEGFAITPLEINDDGTNTRISITQNGDEVYNSTVNESELFVYEEDLNGSGEADNWVLKFNVEIVFKGEYDIEIVMINKTQLISPDVVTIRTPDSDLIPNYIITSQNSDETLQIKLNQPDDIIQLYKGSTVSFLDNSFHFRINVDGDLGGFVAKRSELGTHEIFTQVQFFSGFGDTVWDLASATHPGILYYDFDEGMGDERLHFVINSSDYKIKTRNFLYNTNIYLHEGEPFIAWLGEPYYVIESGSDWYISKVLTNEYMDDTHLIGLKKNLSLPEGFAITPLDFDINDPEVWISITQNGEEVDSAVIKEGDQFIYEKDLNQSGTEDNWVLRFNLERVYKNNDSIRINNTQLISPDVLKISTPDSNIISGFKIDSDVSGNTLQVEFDTFDDNITLTKGDTTSFLNDKFHFRINEDGNFGGIYSTIKVEKQWRDATKSLDTDTNTVCGNVTTLSEFIIAGQNIFDIIVPSAVISEPEECAYINGTIYINGTASDTYFKNYTVEWRNDTSGWTEIHTSTQKVPAGISCLGETNTLTQKGLSGESANPSPGGSANPSPGSVPEGILASWNTTVLTDGNYMIRLTVVDNVSNINTATVNVTIDNILDTNRNGGSSGGGSSSGGTGASGEARENILITETEREYVYNGVEVCYSYDLEGNIVQYINFKGLINAGRIAAKVEILNNTSTLVDTTPTNKVYKNLNIFVGNSRWATSSNIANPTISFTVEKSWITDEKIDKSSIKMYRYSNGKWNELSTSYVTEEADCLHFKSETPGFSPFAIAGEQVSTGKTDTDEDSGVTSPADGDNDTTDPTSSDEKTGLPGFCVLTSLLVILMAVRMLRKK